MFISIFPHDFFNVFIIFMAEFLVAGFIFYKLRKIIKPIAIRKKYILVIHFIITFLLVLGAARMIKINDYYHDQSFITDSECPPFHIYVELVSVFFAFILTRIDLDLWGEIMDKKLGTDITEDEEEMDSK